MRVTGLAAVWSCRDRIISVPYVSDIMDPSKLFLTTKPTPCSLLSFGDFPCQKKMKFFSPREPELESLVSCPSAACLIAAVLQVLLMTWRLSVKSGIIVLTFHVPSFRVAKSFSFLFPPVFSFLLLGVQLRIHLSVFTLNFTHQSGSWTMVKRHITGLRLPSLR